MKAISDMRTAIKNTNVVLNMAITPGIILIPSNMIIIKEKVAGYNNVLTLATKEMKFGVNENVNYVKPVPPTGNTNESSVNQGASLNVERIQKSTEESTLPPKVFQKIDGTTYLLGSAVTLGILVARYVI